jgi:hypothetical protein
MARLWTQGCCFYFYFFVQSSIQLMHALQEDTWEPEENIFRDVSSQSSDPWFPLLSEQARVFF